MARARILEIHSRKMSVSSDVNYEELARSTDEFNGAQLKAVCVEAGMIALREGATKLSHEHFLSGIAEGTSYPCPTAIFTHSGVILDSAKQEEERLDVFRVVYSMVRSCVYLPLLHFLPLSSGLPSTGCY